MNITPRKENVFSFVTLRAPELIGKDKKMFFIQHPDAAASVLASADRAAFDLKLKAFQPLTANGIRALNDELYNFGEFVLTNRKTISADDFESKKPAAPAAASAPNAASYSRNFTDGAMLGLWDNFIYQSFTGKDPAAREAALVMLYADYLQQYAPGNDDGASFKRMLQVRIAVSMEFIFEKTGAAPLTEPVFNPATEAAFTRGLSRVKSEQQLPLLQQLYKAVTVAEKNAVKAERAARANYVSSKAAADKTLAAAAKAAFLAGGGKIDDPQSPTGGNPGSDVVYVPAVFDPVSFGDSLKDELKTVWNNLTADNLPESFAEVKETLSDAMAEHTDAVMNSGTFNKEYTALPGSLIMADSGEPTLSYYAGQYCPLINSDKLSVNAVLAIPAGDSIATVSAVLLQQDEPLATDEAPGIYPNGNGTTGLLLFGGGIAVPALPDNLVLKITIKLQSGKRFLAEGDFSLTACNKVVLKEIVDIPENETVHYGVTRLGIADYRTVQQYVCCYVPGEVSHIENIMAREYKERSTRRLRRSETTDTSETTTEKESLTDSTATDRHEMQQEISHVMNEARDANINAGINWTALGGKLTGSVNAGLATHTSQEESNHSAITDAKEITQRAEEKITQKVREERIVKIIDEYEEQNKHGFDNREGDEHVSGIYRWVDKIYNNEIHNYGKRLMYEFMIPEPAAFHKLAVALPAPDNSTLVRPRDYRSSADMGAVGLFPFRSHRDVKEYNYAALAGLYNVTDLQAPPQSVILIGASLSIQPASDMDHSTAPSDKIIVPEGYQAVCGNAILNLNNTNPHNAWILATVGTNVLHYTGGNFFNLGGERNLVPVTLSGYSSYLSASIEISCTYTAEFFEKWQIATWTAILNGYNAMEEAYQQQLANLQSAATAKDTNPLFYRDMEITVLRKSCISYLLNDNQTGIGFTTGNTLPGFAITRNAALENYSAYVKFIEQAFEWDIMSYQFYPFYWADKGTWSGNYLPQNDDKLFAKFLQSGMARVIVTVRPGFEDAVNWFMATGQVWEGSTAPVINDPLYLSIVDELQNPESTVEETWETRVPTTLTVIQAGGIGLDVQGLPCDCGDKDTGIIATTNVMKASTAADAPSRVVNAVQ